jgi:hypothetical protein
MAEDHRPPGADVVDVALAVGVGHVGAGCGLEEHRRAADAAEGAHRRVDATRDVALGGVEEVWDRDMETKTPTNAVEWHACLC